MNNQVPQSQNEATEEVALEKRRRFIKGAGIAAPVVLSLANRSVFGAQCLSQQISGNMSNISGGSCVLGYKPALWRDPVVGSYITNIAVSQGPTTSQTTLINNAVFKILNDTNAYKLTVTANITVTTYIWYGITNYTYGVLTIRQATATITKGSTTQSGSFKVDSSNSGATYNGTTIVGQTFTSGVRTTEYIKQDANNNSVPIRPVPIVGPLFQCSDFTGGTAFNSPFGGSNTTPMREILCTDVSTESAHCVAALLNASFVPKINYAGGDASEVIAMCNYTVPVPPGYANLTAFFASTWPN